MSTVDLLLQINDIYMIGKRMFMVNGCHEMRLLSWIWFD